MATAAEEIKIIWSNMTMFCHYVRTNVKYIDLLFLSINILHHNFSLSFPIRSKKKNQDVHISWSVLGRQELPYIKCEQAIKLDYNLYFTDMYLHKNAIQELQQISTENINHQ